MREPTQDTPVISIRVPASVRKQLRVIAADRDITVAAMVRNEIERLVEAPQPAKPKR